MPFVGKQNERILSIHLGKKIHGVSLWKVREGIVTRVAIGGGTQAELEYYMEHWFPTEIIFGLKDETPKPIRVPSTCKVIIAHPSWQKYKTHIPYDIYKHLGTVQKRAFRIGFSEVIVRGKRSFKQTEFIQLTSTWFELEGRKY